MPMIYTLVCALIEKLNKDNEIRKQTESDEKYRRLQEQEAEEMVIGMFNLYYIPLVVPIYS
jgi:ferric iron reductase protein FhuF